MEMSLFELLTWYRPPSPALWPEFLFSSSRNETYDFYFLLLGGVFSLLTTTLGLEVVLAVACLGFLLNMLTILVPGIKLSSFLFIRGELFAVALVALIFSVISFRRRVMRFY